jgi:hypothetical protein
VCFKHCGAVITEKGLSSGQIRKERREGLGQLKNWKAALQQFAILYEDRLPLEAPGVTKA